MLKRALAHLICRSLEIAVGLCTLQMAIYISKQLS